MKHFQRLTPAELAEVSRKGGLAKNPKKGTGSLNKRERTKQAKAAANKRWENHEKSK